MNRMFYIFKISWKALRGKNTVSRVFFFCVMILMIFPMILQGISQSFIEEVSESQKDVYGEFTDVLYLERTDHDFGLDQKDINQELNGVECQRYGIIYSIFRDKENDYNLNAGYADDDAIQLGHLKMFQGHYPKAKNEVAVTKGLLQNLNLELQVNQQIELNGHMFEVVGIVEDYGRLWPKREQDIKAGIGSLNIFLSEEDTQTFYCAQMVIAQVLLYRNNRDDSIMNPHVLPNINNQSGPSSTTFKIPSGFSVMMFLCELFILYNVLMLSYEKMRKRCNIYFILGMSKKNIILCILSELTILLISSFVVGTIGGLAILVVVTKIISKLLSTYLPIAGLENLFVSNLICLLIAWICIMAFVFQLMKQLHHEFKFVTWKSKKHFRKNTFLRLVFSEFKCKRSIGVLLILLLGMCSAFLEFGIVYKNYFAFITAYKEYDGKMPFDYDFEFSTVIREPDTQNRQSVYLDDTYEKDGATDEVVSKIKSEKGIERVLLYKENNKVNILLPQEEMDAYLDASDYEYDEAYNPLGGASGLKNVINYNNNILVKTKINGYNDEELIGFQEYIIEGKINLEKLNSGEEVILVAPPFTLTQMSDGGIRKEWCSSETEGCYQNTIFHVGDEITLTQLTSRESYNGGIDKETLLNDYQRVDKKVVIGAILGNYVGWFEKEVTMGESYYLYTTNEAFENLGMDVTYNRLRINIENNSNYKEMSGVMRNISEELPFMYLQDLRMELENYRRLKLLIEIFCFLLICLVEMVLVFCISSQMLFKTNLNLKKYMLLRINGLSEKRTLILLGCQIFILGLLGVSISFPILFLFTYQSFYFDFFVTLGYLLDLEMLGFLLTLIPVFVISLIPSAILIHKTKIKDIL